MLQDVKITVNGVLHEFSVPPQTLLLDLIRQELGLTGTKRGCDGGECGACTVLLDGAPVYACLTLALQANNHQVTTVEGLGTPSNLSHLQQAFIESGAIQCGYCTPGMLLTAKALLDRNPKATRADAARALVGNLCRCTGWQKIFEAIALAAQQDSTDVSE